MSTRQDFLNQQQAIEYFYFPDEIDHSYSFVINWLLTLEGMENFDTARNVDLNSTEWIDTARQVSQFLPAHVIKVYQSLLKVESTLLGGYAGLLEQPNIFVIDVGCGGGSATLGH